MATQRTLGEMKRVGGQGELLPLPPTPPPPPPQLWQRLRRCVAKLCNLWFAVDKTDKGVVAMACLDNSITIRRRSLVSVVIAAAAAGAIATFLLLVWGGSGWRWAPGVREPPPSVHATELGGGGKV